MPTMLITTDDLQKLVDIAKYAVQRVDARKADPARLHEIDGILLHTASTIAERIARTHADGPFIAAAHNLGLDSMDWDFDDDPIVSHGSAGAYVQVWRWISNEEAGVAEVAACHKCGVETPIDELDAKDDGTGNFTILECPDCYGPGWTPAKVRDKEGVA